MSKSRAASPLTLPDIPSPSLGLLFLELRLCLEIPRFALQSFDLKALPRGDGHAVLVIPGFGADDLATRLLRQALKRLGYQVRGWGLGRNLGMRSHIRIGLAQRLDEMYAAQGPVSIIGWSLGGVFARELARHAPHKVRDVFSLGSPIAGRPDANNLNTLFRIATRSKPAPIDVEGFLRRSVPPPVPCIAIYTKQDGIVSWQCSLEPEAENTENIEVRGSHTGLVFNMEVLRILAQRLAC